jgi:hypothetical protein
MSLDYEVLESCHSIRSYVSTRGIALLQSLEATRPGAPTNVFDALIPAARGVGVSQLRVAQALREFFRALSSLRLRRIAKGVALATP